MSNNSTETILNTNKDPLAECLRVVLSFYSIHADIEGILTEIPRSAGLMTPEDILEVARKLSLKAESIPLDTAETWEDGQNKRAIWDNLDTPVIVTLDDGSYRVVFPLRTHQNKTFCPNNGFQEFSLDEFRHRIQGSIILVHPPEADTEMDTRHMWRAQAVDWFWKPIMSFWMNYTEIILCSIFINLVTIALPLYSMNIYDRVVPNFAEATLFVLGSGIFLAVLFDLILRVIRSYILETIAAKVGSKFDFDLLERLLQIRAQDINLSVGERFNLFKELQGIRDFYASKMAPSIVDLPFAVIFLIIILIISPVLFIVPMIGLILVVLLNVFAQIPIKMTTKKHFSSMQKKSTILVETLAGMQTFKMFNATGTRLSRWKLLAAQSADMARHSQFVMGTVATLSSTIMNLVYIFVIFLGVYEIHNSGLTVGGLVACTTLSGRAIAPIISIAGVVGRLRQSQDILKTIDAVFKLPYEGQDVLSNSSKGPFSGHIKFQDVSYTYPFQKRPAVSKVSIDIKPGERVGIIGKTGAGKSTLASLMTGYMHGYEGQISLDAFSLQSIAPTELRRSIAIVPQTSFFFAGTIRENIVMGREDVNDEALGRAIYLAGLDLVLKQSGQGLDTLVGENGDRLSGGQRQAIALARAFLREPRILVFDEPTNGMDQQLEHRIQLSMHEFLKDRTFVMITHRTSLLPLVDRLILIDEGRILADGPRDKIINQLSGREQT